MASVTGSCPYEILEVKPGASQSEVRGAYERIRAIFGPSSLAVYSLVDPEEQRRMLLEIEEAYGVLSDPESRRAYDEKKGHPTPPEEAKPRQALVPPPLPPRALRPVPPATQEIPAPVVPAAEPGPSASEAPAREMPPVGSDTAFTGELLRAIRLARGLSIQEISRRTKITSTHLESIEQERWAWLPERVFLRGFLVSYARELQLNPEQVSATYLRRRSG